MHESGVQESTLQLVMDQVEEVVVAIIEELRERPGVVLAIAAACVGAAIGASLAARGSRRQPVGRLRLARRARGIGDLAELAGLGMRLMQNPIVRGLAVAAIERQLRRLLPL
jgi:hypothetical protein